MIKAAIFDLDGTISDTVSTIAHYGNLSLNYYGFPSIEVEKFKYFAGDGKKVLIHRMLDFLGLDTEENFLKVEKKYDSEYEKDVIFESKPFDQIPELLTKLRENGIKTAVLSNKPHNVTKMLVDKVFKNLIDVCYGKVDGVPAKPAPDGVFKVISELSVNPEDCIFVGDTNVDIKTAKNANIISVGVLWGFRDEKELREARADFIVQKPMDIFDFILKIENEKKREN